MECPSCLLRYNSKQRSPSIATCGHSICLECLPKHQKCPVCLLSISQNSKINYSLLELAEKDNSNIDKFVKVCFIGSSGVGKTSLIRLLTNQIFSEDIPSTVGYDFTFIDQTIEGFRVRYQLWDSAGQERYRAISPIHYKNANILVIVYDMNSEPDKNKIPYWLEEAEKHCPEEVTRILVGNKLDLVEGKIAKPFQNDLWQTIKKESVENREVSCKNGFGVDLLWKSFANSFLNRKSVKLIRQELQKPLQFKTQAPRTKLKKENLEESQPRTLLLKKYL